MDKQRDIQTLDWRSTGLERAGLAQGHRGLGCSWTGPGLLIQLEVPCPQRAFPSSLPHTERWAPPSVPTQAQEVPGLSELEFAHCRQAQGATVQQPSRQPAPSPTLRGLETVRVMDALVWPLGHDQLRSSWSWKEEKFSLVRGKFSTFVNLQTAPGAGQGSCPPREAVCNQELQDIILRRMPGL